MLCQQLFFSSQDVNETNCSLVFAFPLVFCIVYVVVKVFDRQALRDLCHGNRYQFDTLRRAKHSSMITIMDECLARRRVSNWKRFPWQRSRSACLSKTFTTT